MGWNTLKIATCAVAALGAGGLLGVPAAHADEQSYFDRLNGESIGDYIDSQQALSMGYWFCNQIRTGRSTQAAYSDFVDFNKQQRLLPAYPQPGIVIGAAMNQLCPDQKYRYSPDDLEYIPASQR